MADLGSRDIKIIYSDAMQHPDGVSWGEPAAGGWADHGYMDDGEPYSVEITRNDFEPVADDD